MKPHSKDEILTIEDYTKFVIDNFQYELTDIELSKKLGISRKTLWKRRKKYGLVKLRNEMFR